MKINADEVRNTRHVHVTFEPYAVKVLLLREVAEALGLSEENLKSLRVDLSDNSTSYVRGDVDLTREEVLANLKAGYSAEELVSMRGTALATLAKDPDNRAAKALLEIVDALDGTSQGLRRETGTSDVVPTPEEIERPSRVAGDPDPKPRVDVSAVNEATTQIERVVRTLRRMPTVVEQARGCLDMMQRLSPDSVDVATTVRVFDEVVKVPGEDVFLPIPPARGPNPGTQVGTGTYAPESEELPEVQVDRPEVPDASLATLNVRAEAPATITVSHLMEDLRTVSREIEAAAKHSLYPEVSAHVGNAFTHLSAVLSVLQKYSSCILTEGGDPVVPRRGPTTDVVDTAREKVKHLYERQFHHGQAPRARDLAYLYALLGGKDL